MSFTLGADAYYIGPVIDRLRESRKPTVTTTPPKPKPVTDEQLHAVVEELAGEIQYLHRIIREQDQKFRALDNKLWAFRFSGPLARLFGLAWFDGAKA